VSEMKLFRVSTATYALREGRLLVLKRASGAMSGAWYLPGGGMDDKEHPDEAAARELFEETGLRPDGVMRLISANLIHVYGVDSVQLAYVAYVPDGEIVLDPGEHSDFEWLTPAEFRAREFNAARGALAEAAGEPALGIFRACVRSLDDFEAWFAERGGT
jgi:8-oxo-dGTP diphosphatase